MTEKRLLLIVNPKAGLGKIKNRLFRVTEILSNGGYEVTLYLTKRQNDAYNRIVSGIEEFDTLVVCGGDGTLNEVVNGVIATGTNIAIGYIPAGTLNEWSVGLKISRNIEQAAKDIVGGRISPLDVGRFNGRHFTYTASFGAFTEASYSARQEVKNVLGQAAYFFEGIKSLGNIKATKMIVETESKFLEGEFIFGAVSNSLSVGGIVKLNENNVDLNDGFFEVLLIRYPESLAKLQKIVDAIIKKDFNREGIEFFKAAKIKIHVPKKTDWTLDGEHEKAEREIVIKNLKSRINFILPNK